MRRWFLLTPSPPYHPKGGRVGVSEVGGASAVNRELATAHDSDLDVTTDIQPISQAEVIDIMRLCCACGKCVVCGACGTRVGGVFGVRGVPGVLGMFPLCFNITRRLLQTCFERIALSGLGCCWYD